MACGRGFWADSCVGAGLLGWVALGGCRAAEEGRVGVGELLAECACVGFSKPGVKVWGLFEARAPGDVGKASRLRS